MGEVYDKAASDFLELASHQRLNILFKLLEERSKISVIARELKATTQEVSRNFERLNRAGLIVKDSDGFFNLSTFGKAICIQVPSLIFLSQNRKYFESHNFNEIGLKFIQRIGALVKGKPIKGHIKVQEKWNQIHNDAKDFIYCILAEIPLELIKLTTTKAKQGVNIQAILSEEAITPQGRKELVSKPAFKKFLQEGKIQRKMRKTAKIVVVVNESEACVSFPSLEGEVDLSLAFSSSDEKFHEWCLDYFRYCWHNSKSFQESKIKE